MNPKTSVPQVDVKWSPQEVHSIQLAQLRELAQERLAAGDAAAARELEVLASRSEAALEAARAQWQAEYGEVYREVEPQVEVDR
ncbi:MAG: hypothetical protein J2P38_04945 [Candidatus Dormibacteraeota bacterium]|nr:hypothetical protein [Candidatus Dormibacteraeota bacterium]